jgi:hypothetical protein
MPFFFIFFLFIAVTFALLCQWPIKTEFSKGIADFSKIVLASPISHASAVAQGNVVRAMSASYWKNLYSTLRSNQTS